ncbi:hypothetical protein [Lacisediminihabitans changchengi]|uniref:Uncharacterized protein n=1 Tax=Lacisediminihabitans changchengi TaxID=2787634 RepID=A0A934SIF1_9MICO|nr:hypothetical protein [Lacisediminihabitans changchengi]MBK4347242.1 hypothetical protein [Lacisediminihabitans changchengi]
MRERKRSGRMQPRSVDAEFAGTLLIRVAPLLSTPPNHLVRIEGAIELDLMPFEARRLARALDAASRRAEERTIEVTPQPLGGL